MSAGGCPAEPAEVEGFWASNPGRWPPLRRDFMAGITLRLQAGLFAGPQLSCNITPSRHGRVKLSSFTVKSQCNEQPNISVGAWSQGQDQGQDWDQGQGQGQGQDQYQGQDQDQDLDQGQGKDQSQG